jgi:glutathione S-transferase
MSPYAAKVHSFLLFKQVPFEAYYINPLRVKQELPVGRQIPVLTIDGESRADSTPIGIWLDEAIPGKRRLLPHDPAERERVLAIDQWISDRLIPSHFRAFPGEGVDRFLNGWKLSHVMANTARGGLPLPLRVAWPVFIKRVGFVRRVIAQADDGRSPRETKLARWDEFIDHLGAGAFLGGRDEPSFADVAAYPQFALYWWTGFRGSEDILARPRLLDWLRRMQQEVHGDPPVMPARLRKRELPV